MSTYSCIDGWMDGWDGWMGWDGLVSTCFFSAYCTKTTWYMTLIVFMPLRSLNKTSFVKKSNFFKKIFTFKKFRTKRVFFFCPGNRPFFFSDFFYDFLRKKSCFLVISRKILIVLFWLIRVPLGNFRDFFLENFLFFQKKSNNFFFVIFSIFLGLIVLGPVNCRLQVRILLMDFF